MNTHVKLMHEGQKFPCKFLKYPIYERKFWRQSKLSNHIQYVHEDEKSLFCKLCGSKHTLEIDLTIHFASAHKGEKAFKCQSSRLASDFAKLTLSKVYP